MSLFDYRNFIAPFGGLSAKVHHAFPAALQWLTGLATGGVSLEDAKDVVNPEPEVRDVNCMYYDLAATRKTTFPALKGFSTWTGFSIEFWARIDPTAVHASGGRILSIQHTSGDDIRVLPQSGNLSITCDDGVNTDGFTWANVNDDTWHHYQLTYDGVTLRSYEDGIAGPTAPVTFNFAGATGAVSLGSNFTTAYATGYLSQVKITEYVPQDSTTFIAPLVSEECLDASGNGNHATANNGLLSTADGIPSWTHEKGFTPSVVSDGTTQYIDTEVLADDTTVVEVGMVWNEDAPLNQRIGASNPYLWFGGSGSGAWQMGFGQGSSQSGSPIEANTLYNVRLEAAVTSARLYINGVQELEINNASPDLSGTTPYQLFARSNSNWANANIYWAKIWKGGVLVRDMIPLPNGQFLDKVENVVYSNDGTGTLTTKYTPALADGTLAADGSAITNPGGYDDVHNGSEVTLIQTGALSVASDGTGQYITLGVDPQQITKIRYRATHRNTGANGVVLGGIARLAGSPYQSVFTQSIATINFYFGSGDKRTANGSITFGVPTTVEVDVVAETISIDDVDQVLQTGPGSLAVTGGTGELFGRTGGASGFDGDIEFVELYYASGLVRNMIPRADGTFLDQVNDVVYSNDGTGTLTSDLNVFGGATIWGDGVTAWDKVSYAQFMAQPDGVDGFTRILASDGVSIKVLGQADVSP